MIVIDTDENRWMSQREIEREKFQSWRKASMKFLKLSLSINLRTAHTYIHIHTHLVQQRVNTHTQHRLGPVDALTGTLSCLSSNNPTQDIVDDDSAPHCCSTHSLGGILQTHSLKKWIHSLVWLPFLALSCLTPVSRTLLFQPCGSNKVQEIYLRRCGRQAIGAAIDLFQSLGNIWHTDTLGSLRSDHQQQGVQAPHPSSRSHRLPAKSYLSAQTTLDHYWRRPETKLVRHSLRKQWSLSSITSNSNDDYFWRGVPH